MFAAQPHPSLLARQWITLRYALVTSLSDSTSAAPSVRSRFTDWARVESIKRECDINPRLQRMCGLRRIENSANHRREQTSLAGIIFARSHHRCILSSAAASALTNIPRHRISTLHTSAALNYCASRGHSLCRSARNCPALHCSTALSASSSLVYPVPSITVHSLSWTLPVSTMITRRKTPQPTGRASFLVVVLAVLLSVLCLLVLPASCAAFQTLHTATSVNDTVDAPAVPTASASPAASSAAIPPEFVPTDAWQTVQPGQPIPPGL